MARLVASHKKLPEAALRANDQAKVARLSSLVARISPFVPSFSFFCLITSEGFPIFNGFSNQLGKTDPTPCERYNFVLLEKGIKNKRAKGQKGKQVSEAWQ